jgi:hypothetical protein
MSSNVAIVINPALLMVCIPVIFDVSLQETPYSLARIPSLGSKIETFPMIWANIANQ